MECRRSWKSFDRILRRGRSGLAFLLFSAAGLANCYVIGSPSGHSAGFAGSLRSWGLPTASQSWSSSFRKGVAAEEAGRDSVVTDTGLYSTLGVEKDATVAEIKKAYYRAARDSHPDKFPDDENMRSRFQEVADAYATLADPVRRQSYDLQGLAALANFRTNASRLFGPPPWRVLIGRTDHWMWDEDKTDYMVGLFASSIPNGIAGVTMKTVKASYEECLKEGIAVLLERVSEEQAKDTVEQIEEFGLAVKAEPIEAERSNEQESPIQCFRRIQRDLGQAAESLRAAAVDLQVDEVKQGEDAEFEKWIDMVRGLRSELRAAAQGLEEFKLSKTSERAR